MNGLKEATALTNADVEGIVESIRRDWRENAARNWEVSICDHARARAYGMIRAVALTAHQTDAQIVASVRAVIEAVDVVTAGEITRIGFRREERADRAAGMPPHDRCFHRGKCSEDCPVDPCAGGRCTDPVMHAEGGHDW